MDANRAYNFGVFLIKACLFSKLNVMSLTPFMEIDYEIFSAVILSLPLKGKCQVLAKECTQVLVKYLEV